MPDYGTFDISPSFSTPFGNIAFTLNLTVTEHGHVFFGGGAGGSSSPGLTSSYRAGWINRVVKAQFP